MVARRGARPGKHVAVPYDSDASFMSCNKAESAGFAVCVSDRDTNGRWSVAAARAGRYKLATLDDISWNTLKGVRNRTGLLDVVEWPLLDHVHGDGLLSRRVSSYEPVRETNTHYILRTQAKRPALRAQRICDRLDQQGFLSLVPCGKELLQTVVKSRDAHNLTDRNAEALEFAVRGSEASAVVTM